VPRGILAEGVAVSTEQAVVVALAVMVAALEVEITEKMGPLHLVPLILAVVEEVVGVQNM
jgi:hypothetical protein